MKNLLIAISFICLLTSCGGPKELPTITKYEATHAEVKLSHETTKAEMDEIIIALDSQYKAQFSYEGSRFFDNGKLRDLKMRILLSSGQSGKGSAMLAHLEYKYYGFVFDIQNAEGTGLKIGTF